jgi:TPP-dependent pyruvate/acetoin dehydrogenase alpha subunit
MDGLELYVRMCFLRHFEERVDVLYRRGLIHGPAHLGLGQEAIAVGAASVLRPGDCSLGTYRGHAHALARGAPPDAAASLEAEVDVSAARVLAAARAVLNYR